MGGRPRRYRAGHRRRGRRRIAATPAQRNARHDIAVTGAPGPKGAVSAALIEEVVDDRDGVLAGTAGLAGALGIRLHRGAVFLGIDHVVGVGVDPAELAEDLLDVRRQVLAAGDELFARDHLVAVRVGRLEAERGPRGVFLAAEVGDPFAFAEIDEGIGPVAGGLDAARRVIRLRPGISALGAVLAFDAVGGELGIAGVGGLHVGLAAQAGLASGIGSFGARALLGIGDGRFGLAARCIAVGHDRLGG